MSDMEVAEITHRTVTLMDVAGHAKYLKTTLHGMVGQKPDYICVCVSAVRGLTRMTMEHVSLAVYLNVPLLLFVTKVDLVLSKAQRALVQRGTWTYATLVAEVPALQKIYGELQEQLQATGGRLVVIGSARELMNYFAPSTAAATTAAGPAPGEQHKRTIPIVLLSSVTGEGVALVKSILFQLPTPKKALRILPLALANPPFAVQPTAATTVKAMTDGGDHATMVSVPTKQRLNYVRVLGALTVTDAKADDALLVDAIAEGDADADADDDADDGLDWGDDDDEGDDGGDGDDGGGDGGGGGDAKKAAPRYEFDSRRYGQDHSDLLAPPAASKRNTTTATSAAAAGAIRHSSYAQFLQTEKGQRHVADAQRGSVLRLQPPQPPASPTAQPSPPAASAAPASPTAEEPPAAAPLTPEAAQWERDYAALLAEVTPFVANAAAAPPTASSPTTAAKTILLGKVMQGRLTLGDVLVLGPSPQGVFVPVAVASLRLNNVPVRYAKTGQTATFQLARVDAMPAAYAAATAARAAVVGAGDAPPPPTVTATDGDAATTPPVPPTVASGTAGGRRRTDAGGLVLLPLDVRPMATWEFTAELSVLSTATATATGRPRRAAIKVGYEAVVHVGAARQTAKVVDVVRLSSAATVATDAAPLPSRSSAAQLSPIDVTTATSVDDDEEKKRLGPPSLTPPPSLATPSHVHGSACSIQMWRESSTGSDAGAGAAGAAARTVAVGHDASAVLSTDADGDAGGRGTFIVTDATPRRVLPALVDVAAAATSTTDAVLVDGAAVNGEAGAAAPAAAGPVAELFEGDRALVKFRFVFCPEFVSVGEAMILREDRIRALGTVIETAPFLNDPLYAER